MKNDYLQSFLNHEILIDISKTTREQLKELEEITGKRWIDGTPLEDTNFTEDMIYLHCDPVDRRYAHEDCTISYSDVPTEDGETDLNNALPYISIAEFLQGDTIKEIVNDDLEKLFDE